MSAPPRNAPPGITLWNSNENCNATQRFNNYFLTVDKSPFLSIFFSHIFSYELYFFYWIFSSLVFYVGKTRMQDSVRYTLQIRLVYNYMIIHQYISTFIKFIYSENATIFCEISTVDFSYVVTVKSTVEISQNFVAFSEYMNFIILCYQGNVNVAPRWYPYNINRTKKLWYRYT